MKCIYCNSENLHKRGSYKEKQQYQCKNCGKYFTKGNVENKYEYIIHFNIKLRKTPNNKLTRDNYCNPPDKIDSTHRYLIKKYKGKLEQYENYIKVNGETSEVKREIELINKFYNIFVNMPNEVFTDEEHYTETYKNKVYKDCMKNFDMNMEYFAKLNHEDFTQYIERFVKKYKLSEVNDLNVLNNKNGIYILVLDEYNQVYIGVSNNIKKRIQNHWSNKKEFSRLIYGNVNTSILSIDSFGALDTTRIYYKEVNGFFATDKEEEKLVKTFKKEYRLNRVAGGINGEENSSLRNLMLLSSTQKRKLK